MVAISQGNIQSMLWRWRPIARCFSTRVSRRLRDICPVRPTRFIVAPRTSTTTDASRFSCRYSIMHDLRLTLMFYSPPRSFFAFSNSCRVRECIEPQHGGASLMLFHLTQIRHLVQTSSAICLQARFTSVPVRMAFLSIHSQKHHFGRLRFRISNLHLQTDTRYG